MENIHLPVQPFSLLNPDDIERYQSGEHSRIYEKLGSREVTCLGNKGTYFAVWAPHAKRVSVVGDFNGWNPSQHVLFARWDESGIWEGFIPAIADAFLYKYCIVDALGELIEKGDPFAFRWENRPKTASITCNLSYAWQDEKWMEKRHRFNSFNKPFSVYEVHLGSWRRNPEFPSRFLSYRQLAVSLPQYCSSMGFTHVELMPVMEHPLDASWGYQQTGYYAASARFGSPQDLMYLIDVFHEFEIAVIMDWVPSHFPYDKHGLHQFDGTSLYEHGDVRKGFHPDWKSYIFDTGRMEVKSFLLSNAVFWFDYYHIDGMRVDAVASMLQLNYSRKEGEWIPNIYGGSENLENISFLRQLNDLIYSQFPGVQMIAEESSTWPGVTHSTNKNGLGFGMKWMMGWMNDTLTYFKREPIYRKHHHNDITFSFLYAFTERFMLPLSHDEVVHGKSSMIGKMPGDEWNRYANLRLLYTYMWMHPGAKLLFMGNEFAQDAEWNFATSLDWHLLEHPSHRGIQNLVKQLNHTYKSEPALYERSFDANGFEWIAGDDTENSILVFIRKGENEMDHLIVVLNFNDKAHSQYRIGVPKAGQYIEVFNSDASVFWGRGGHNELLDTEVIKMHTHENSISINLPALSGVAFKLKQ